MRSVNFHTLLPILLITPVSLVLATCGGDSGTDPGPDDPEIFTLTVEVSGDGTGTVTSTPAGIACSSADGTCTATFEETTGVTLTAAPDGENEFAGWSDSCSGTAGCSLTITGDATVGAEFDDVTVTTQTVGTAGAAIESPDGSLGLTVPAGALTSDQEVTVRGFEPADLTGDLATLRDQVGITTAFQFGPDGLEFEEPVTMAFETGTTIEAGAAEYNADVALLTGEGTSTTELLDQTLEIDPATGALTIEGELTHFSLLTPIDDGVIFRVDPPPFVAGNQANLSIELGVPTEIATVLPLTDFSAFYADAGSENLVPNFEGQFPLAVGSGGNLWRGAPGYTCPAAGPATLNYEFLLQHSSGGTIVHRFNRDLTCDAVPPETVEIIFDGSGAGAVTSDPAGIDCTSDTTSCLGEFAPGTELTLTAVPGSTSDFCGYADAEGIVLSDDASFTFTVNESLTLRSCFDPQPLLTITFGGSGGGGVTSDPAGLDCLSGGDTCRVQFPAGTEVTLQANPASDSEFCGWFEGGSLFRNDLSLTFVLGEDGSFEACFAEKAPSIFRWNVSDIQSSGSQINAGIHDASFTNMNNNSQIVTVPMTVFDRVFVDQSRNVLGLDVNDAPISFNMTAPQATGIQAPEAFSFRFTGNGNSGSPDVIVELRDAANEIVRTEAVNILNGTQEVFMNSTVTPVIQITNRSAFYFFDFLLDMAFIPCSGSSCNQ